MDNLNINKKILDIKYNEIKQTFKEREKEFVEFDTVWEYTIIMKIFLDNGEVVLFEGSYLGDCDEDGVSPQLTEVIGCQIKDIIGKKLLTIKKIVSETKKSNIYDDVPNTTFVYQLITEIGSTKFHFNAPYGYGHFGLVLLRVYGCKHNYKQYAKTNLVICCSNCHKEIHDYDFAIESEIWDKKRKFDNEIKLFRKQQYEYWEKKSKEMLKEWNEKYKN